MNDGDRDPIVRIAARGDGISAAGHHVPHSAPGDWLDAGGNLHHGPHRQTPPCPHFTRCGGCTLQHVDDWALAQFCTSRIETALAAHQLTAGEMRVPHLSPAASRRRVSMKAQRMGNNVRLGFTEAGSHRLIDIRQCNVMRPELEALLVPLRRLLLKLMGPRSAATLQMTVIDQGVDVLLTGVSGLGLEAHDAIIDFCAGGGIARLAIDAGDGPQDRWAPEPASVTINCVAVPIPYAAFLQATSDGEQVLIDAVLAAASGAERIADLFCGIGTFALSMPANCRVHALEASRDALFALQMAINRSQRLITVEHRDLYRRPLTAKELARFDAVVIDPPRAGAKEQVEEIAASNVPVVAYVSCNPTSFVRDAAILVAAGYTIKWVQPVGQFRWSTHVELVACFVR